MLCLAVILKGSSCLEIVISTFLPLSSALPLSLLASFSNMNPVFNRLNGGLIKGKAKDTKDIVLSPPSTPSYQKKTLPPLPPLSEWPLSLEQPPPSIGTPTFVTSFEPIPKAELPSLSLESLLSIGDTEGYITTSATHSEVSLSNVAVEEPTDTAVTFDIALPRANHDSASHNIPPLPHIKEWPPPLEQPQCSIGTATLITSSVPLPGLLSLPIPPIADRADYDTSATTNSGTPSSDVAVDVSADTDITVAFDIASPRVDQDQTKRSSCGNSNGNISTSYGDNDALPPPHSVKLDFNDNDSIDQPSPLTQPPYWSEDAEEDLVTHLGPSERSRQEIMWEIVKSEER